MAKRPSSSRWLQRQRKDPFVKRAQQSQYRSRAVYKLIEIDEQYRLFHRGQTIVDLGAAPGSWSQYAAHKTAPGGNVVAVDILPLQPIKDVFIIQGDITDDTVMQQCVVALNGARADLVISDMAPNLSGIKVTDQARSLALAELARELALQILKPGGDFLVKIFQGGELQEFQADLKQLFHNVIVRKPKASRDSSSEIYLLGRSLK